MKEIKLTQGKVALVDDEDFEQLNQFKWSACKNGNTFYATNNFHNTLYNFIYSLHRLILLSPDFPAPGKTVDHIDGNGLNNQKSNLRIVTHRQNMQNLHIKTTSKYPGVSWHNASKKWQAAIMIEGKQFHLGIFDSEEKAYEAYCLLCPEPISNCWCAQGKCERCKATGCHDRDWRARGREVP